MNEVRKEKEERKYLLERAKNDKEKMRNFARLVDYLTVETLVNTNFISMNFLLEEMRRDRKKSGLFNTVVQFDI